MALQARPEPEFQSAECEVLLDKFLTWRLPMRLVHGPFEKSPKF